MMAKNRHDDLKGLADREMWLHQCITGSSVIKELSCWWVPEGMRKIGGSWRV